MKIGLRKVSHEAIQWFCQAVSGGGYSRYGLAKQLCARMNWRNAKGKLCATQASKSLPFLADRLSLELPAVRFAKPQVAALPSFSRFPCRIAPATPKITTQGSDSR